MSNYTPAMQPACSEKLEAPVATAQWSLRRTSLGLRGPDENGISFRHPPSPIFVLQAYLVDMLSLESWGGLGSHLVDGTRLLGHGWM